MSLSISSTVKLPSGALMPMLGLGAFEMRDALTSCSVGLQAGYRHIDSARYYKNEELVAESWRRSSGLKREDVFLTTKIMSHEHGTKATRDALDDSLRRSGLQWWSLVLLHDPNAGKRKRIEAFAALAEAQKQGLVQDIGVSNFGVRHLQELKQEGLPTPAVNQVELHPRCQQKEIASYCKEHGIAVQAYCPLVRGKMMDDPTLQSVAKALKKDPAQILVRWSLQRGYIPLPKSDTPARIKSNADVYDFEIPKNLMAELDALDKGAGGAISWNPINAP